MSLQGRVLIMRFLRTTKVRITEIFILLSFIAAVACPLAGQTLDQRLTQQTDFIPQTASPTDQLIEVGSKFQIPLAIEWLDEKEAGALYPLSFRGGSVGELIQSIVQRSPTHQLLVDDRIVHIYSSLAYNNPLNFLNLQITGFNVKAESLLGAEAALRHSINELLYPELYRNGWAGGYGCGCPPEFWKRNITFSGSNLTIRQVLNLIVEESRKFLWVVRLDREELTGEEPKWVGVSINETGHSPLNSRWRFVLLGDELSNKDLKLTADSHPKGQELRRALNQASGSRLRDQ
jgi:hypothetical protein